MLRTIVRNVVPNAIVAAARRAPATAEVPLVAVPMTAAARRAVIVRPVASSHRVHNGWSYRLRLSFCRSRNVSPHWCVKFTTPNGRIR